MPTAALRAESRVKRQRYQSEALTSLSNTKAVHLDNNLNVRRVVSKVLAWFLSPVELSPTPRESVMDIGDFPHTPRYPSISAAESRSWQRDEETTIASDDVMAV